MTAFSQQSVALHAIRAIMLAICSCHLPSSCPHLNPVTMREADDLRVFHSGDHACGYFDERTARDLVIDPRDPRLAQTYPTALGWGFRRSGDIVYRPHCQACRACIAVRVPVDTFAPSRSQRRCLKRNADIDVRVLPAQRTDEQLALYRRYLQARHANGGMHDHGAVEFELFLAGTWSNTRFFEMRQRGDHQLLGVAVTDLVPDAVSAVYTFFDPDSKHADRGLGTFGVLSQIDWAKREGRQFVYLGYWIAGHDKMDYKRRFRPLQGFDGGQWRAMEFADSP